MTFINVNITLPSSKVKNSCPLNENGLRELDLKTGLVTQKFRHFQHGGVSNQSHQKDFEQFSWQTMENTMNAYLTSTKSKVSDTAEKRSFSAVRSDVLKAEII